MPSEVILNIMGTASTKDYPLKINGNEQSMLVLDFLRKNSIGIASSCNAQQVCKLCMVRSKHNDEVLTCSLSVSDFINKYGNELSIEYL